MPPSLTSRVEVVISGTLYNLLDLADVTSPLARKYFTDFSNGAGANQANVIWSDQRTLGPSASETLDLIGGGLVDAIGVAVAPARLRAVLIYASPANLNNLTILGNAAAVPILNTVATTITLTPGGLFLITKPDAVGMLVTATTFDLIQVANAAGVNSVVYDIVLLGGAT
jgi:hypothetical protein